MRPRFLSTLALLALAPGCGGDTPMGNNAARAVLGTGTVEFEPLLAEQELGLVAGPQGGHHFIVHARILEMLPGDPSAPGLPDNPATQFAVFLSDGRRIDLGFPPYRLGYRTKENGWFALPSGRILQVEEAEVLALYGQQVRITVEVRDALGSVASDERWVEAVADEPAAPPDAGPDPDGSSGPDAGP